MKVCTVEGCDRKHSGRGYCGAHYRQWWKGQSFTAIQPPVEIQDGKKRCRSCREWFPIEHFEAPRARCRECVSVRRRAGYRGVSEEQIRDLLAAGRCHACGVGLTLSECQVDHCHTTGSVRGVLCAKCNLALGYLDDDEAKILSLLAYLKRTR